MHGFIKGFLACVVLGSFYVGIVSWSVVLNDEISNTQWACRIVGIVGTIAGLIAILIIDGPAQIRKYDVLEGIFALVVFASFFGAMFAWFDDNPSTQLTFRIVGTIGLILGVVAVYFVNRKRGKVE